MSTSNGNGNGSNGNGNGSNGNGNGNPQEEDPQEEDYDELDALLADLPDVDPLSEICNPSTLGGPDAYDRLLDEIDLSSGLVPLCVRDSFNKQQDKSWCGRDIDAEEVLESVDHALYAANAGDAPCSKCMDVIRSVAILPLINHEAPERQARLSATYKDDLNIPDELKPELDRMSMILRPETFALIDPHNTQADLPRLLNALPTTLPVAVEGHVVAAHVIDWFAMYKMLHAEYLGEMRNHFGTEFPSYAIDFTISRLVALQIDGILTVASRLDLPFSDFIHGVIAGSVESYRSAHAEDYESLPADVEAQFTEGREILVREAARTMEDFMRLVVRLGHATRDEATPKKQGRPKFSRLEFWNEISAIADTLTEIPTVGAFAEMVPSVSREDRKEGKAGTSTHEKNLTAKRVQGRKRALLYAKFKECKKAGLTNIRTVEEFLREKINTTVH